MIATDQEPKPNEAPTSANGDRGHLTTADERAAEALAIQQLYGEDAPRWIAERIAILALAGDFAGVNRFRAIAAMFERYLLRGSRPRC